MWASATGSPVSSNNDQILCRGGGYQRASSCAWACMNYQLHGVHILFFTKYLADVLPHLRLDLDHTNRILSKYVEKTNGINGRNSNKPPV